MIHSTMTEAEIFRALEHIDKHNEFCQEVRLRVRDVFMYATGKNPGFYENIFRVFVYGYITGKETARV